MMITRIFLAGLAASALVLAGTGCIELAHLHHAGFTHPDRGAGRTRPVE